MFTLAETELLLQDTGGVVVVIPGNDATWGHVHAADAEVQDQLRVTVPMQTVTVPTERAAGVRNGDVITVDGENHVVRGHNRGREPDLTQLHTVVQV